jgi:hypothetical protein
MQNSASTPVDGIPEAIGVGTLPRNWERAFGYDGDAPFLAVWWEPAGDEARYCDGFVSADGHWPVYLDLVDRQLALSIAQALAHNPRGRWALGSSDESASHCLLLDLVQRTVHTAPLGETMRFLKDQVPPLPPVTLTSEEVAELMERFREEMFRELTWTPRSYRTCSNGCNMGWFVGADGGYDPCPECGGKWLIPAA